MIKETITFKDLDDNDITQDFYFGYNKKELTVMEASKKGGLISLADKLTNENDGEKLMALFEDLILGAYGVKDADNIHFIKEDPVDHHKLADDFKQTDAYNVIFMKCLNDEDFAGEFFNGCLPKEASDSIADMKSKEELPGQKNYKGPEALNNIVERANKAGAEAEELKEQ